MTLNGIREMIKKYTDIVPEIMDVKITKENEAMILYPLVYTLLDIVKDKDEFYHLYSELKPEVDAIFGEIE